MYRKIVRIKYQKTLVPFVKKLIKKTSLRYPQRPLGSLRANHIADTIKRAGKILVARFL